MGFLVFTTTPIGHRFYFLEHHLPDIGELDGRTNERTNLRLVFSYVIFLVRDGNFYYLEFFIFLGGTVAYFSMNRGYGVATEAYIDGVYRRWETDGRHDDDGIHIPGIFIYDYNFRIVCDWKERRNDGKKRAIYLLT